MGKEIPDRRMFRPLDGRHNHSICTRHNNYKEKRSVHITCNNNITMFILISSVKLQMMQHINYFDFFSYITLTS